MKIEQTTRSKNLHDANCRFRQRSKITVSSNHQNNFEAFSNHFRHVEFYKQIQKSKTNIECAKKLYST